MMADAQPAIMLDLAKLQEEVEELIEEYRTKVFAGLLPDIKLQRK